MLVLHGLLAAVGLFASDLPRSWAWMAAPVALAYSVWIARRELRRPWRVLSLPATSAVRERSQQGPFDEAALRPVVESGSSDRVRGEDAGGEPSPSLDGVPLAGIEVRWRGTAAFLDCRGQDGRRQRVVLWPDVCSALERRELRLALRDRATSPSRPSVAP